MFRQRDGMIESGGKIVAFDGESVEMVAGFHVTRIEGDRFFVPFDGPFFLAGGPEEIAEARMEKGVFGFLF